VARGSRLRGVSGARNKMAVWSASWAARSMAVRCKSLMLMVGLEGSELVGVVVDCAGNEEFWPFSEARVGVPYMGICPVCGYGMLASAHHIVPKKHTMCDLPEFGTIFGIYPVPCAKHNRACVSGHNPIPHHVCRAVVAARPLGDAQGDV
jgi:hypothetical protein